MRVPGHHSNVKGEPTNRQYASNAGSLHKSSNSNTNCGRANIQSGNVCSFVCMLFINYQAAIIMSPVWHSIGIDAGIVYTFNCGTLILCIILYVKFMDNKWRIFMYGYISQWLERLTANQQSLVQIWVCTCYNSPKAIKFIITHQPLFISNW